MEEPVGLWVGLYISCGGGRREREAVMNQENYLAGPVSLLRRMCEVKLWSHCFLQVSCLDVFVKLSHSPIPPPSSECNCTTERKLLNTGLRFWIIFSA